MNRNEFSWKNARGLEIYAQEWQPDADPHGVVAVVHGLGEHVGRYQHVAEALNQAGYGVVGFDLAGHGKSEGTRGHTSYDDALEDIDRLLKEAAERYPEKPRFLYGHSLGGALTIYYALKRRPALNGFIATSPGLVPGAPVPAIKLLLAQVMAKIKPDFTMDNGLEVSNLSRDTAVVQAYKDDPLVHGQISARLGLDLLTRGEWMQAQAKHFPGPLLLTLGDGDHLVSQHALRVFAEAVPEDKLTYKEWPGCYHETHNDLEKKLVLQTMIDWLDSHI